MEVFFSFFFSNAVATRNGLLVKPAIELWPLPCRAHFRARREPGTIPLVLTYHPTNALVKKIITRNMYLVLDDRETAAIFQPLRILCAYRRYSNLRDCLVGSALDNTRAISIWISLWRFWSTRKRYVCEKLKVTMRDAKEDVDKVCINVRKTSDNAGGKPTRGISLQHKTFM